MFKHGATVSINSQSLALIIEEYVNGRIADSDDAVVVSNVAELSSGNFTFWFRRKKEDKKS